MQNIKKIQKEEIKFFTYLQKMYVKYPEWSLNEFKSIYNRFTKFAKKIHSDEISLLRKGEVFLRDNEGTLKKLLDMSLNEKQWYIFKIITSPEIDVSIYIILVGTICKLTIEDTTDLEKLL